MIINHSSFKMMKQTTKQKMIRFNSNLISYLFMYNTFNSVILILLITIYIYIGKYREFYMKIYGRLFFYYY